MRSRPASFSSEKIKTNNRHADPFGRFSFLDGYDIYAGDGHYHAASVHDVKKGGKKYPTQYFYSAELGYDKKDPINAGVQSYELVGCSPGVTVHRVVYNCPLSGETYGFVTSLTDVAPGLIAYLYKSRWDIEKIFDQVKNKLAEKKAWATSDTAKSMQAQFVCLAHNLMLILEQCLKKEGVVNEIENNRRQKKPDEVLASSKTRKDKLSVFLKTPKRPTQLTLLGDLSAFSAPQDVVLISFLTYHRTFAIFLISKTQFPIPHCRWTLKYR